MSVMANGFGEALKQGILGSVNKMRNSEYTSSRIAASVMDKAVLQPSLPEPMKSINTPSAEDTSKFYRGVGLDTYQVIVSQYRTVEAMVRKILGICRKGNFTSETCKYQVDAILEVLKAMLANVIITKDDNEKLQWQKQQVHSNILGIMEPMDNILKAPNRAKMNDLIQTAARKATEGLISIVKEKFHYQLTSNVRPVGNPDDTRSSISGWTIAKCARKESQIEIKLKQDVGTDFENDSKLFESLRRNYLNPACWAQLAALLPRMFVKMEEIAEKHDSKKLLPTEVGNYKLEKDSAFLDARENFGGGATRCAVFAAVLAGVAALAAAAL